MKNNQDTELIRAESPEILYEDESQDLLKKIIKAFPAFKHRNYRLYFTGQLISMIGTWLQTVAQGWLVLELTHSAFWVGTVASLGTLPGLFFSLHGGLIVDRFSRKKILYFTQYSSLFLAVLLGVLTVLHVVTLWEIILISALLGAITAIDLPARQAFSVDLVGKEDLHSAIALNSGLFNAARVIGPGVAGLLIALFGTGGAFILNGLSFLALVIALNIMSIKETVHAVHPNAIKAIKEGISYAFTHRIIRTLLIMSSIVSIFGWSYITIMPVVTEKVFGKDASGLGILYMASGLGALLGTFFVSSVSKKVSSSMFIFLGGIIFSLSLIVFSYTTNFNLALIFMFLSGLGLILQFAIMNTSIQRHVEDSLRGRVMSLYTLTFLGLAPLGSFEIGIIAEHFGSMFALRMGAIIVLVASLYFFKDKSV